MPFSGGGNKANLELDRSAVSLVWMLKEAQAAGLSLIDLDATVGVNYPDITESLVGPWWWFLELMPVSRHSYRASAAGNTNASVR